MNSKLKLLGSPTSPFVRKVRVVAYELQIPLVLEFVNVREPSVEFLTLAPIGKIPVLITDQGETIPESDLIARYLCVRANDSTMFPGTFDLEFERILSYINAGLDAAAGIIMEHWRREAAIDQGVIQRHRDRVVRVLGVLESNAGRSLQVHRYLELALSVFLGYIEFRKPVVDWRDGHKWLSDWYLKIVDKPYFYETLPSLQT